MKKKITNTHRLVASAALLLGGLGVGAGASYAAAPPSTDAPSSTAAPSEDAPSSEESCTVTEFSEGFELPDGAEVPEGDSQIAVWVEDEDGTVESYDSLDPALKEEIINDIKSANDAFIAELDAKGVDYTMENDPVLGIDVPIISDEAAAELLDGVDLSGTLCEDGFISTEGGEGEVIFDTDEEMAAFAESLSPAEKADMAEDMKALNAEITAALDEAGIDYEVITEPVTGLEVVSFDCDNEEAQQVVDSVFEAHLDAAFADEAPADEAPADAATADA